MKLLILLLALSGIVLASPRERGPQVVQSGVPHGDQHRYYQKVQFDTRQDSSDPNTVWVKINSKDLQHFEAQVPSFLSTAPNAAQNQEPQAQNIADATFTVPQPVPTLVKSPQRYSPASQHSAASRDTERRKRLQDELIRSSTRQVLRNTATSAQLIAVQPAIPALEDRLPDNYTLILPDPVDTFRCTGRPYGYYGDVDNECKIFHVCLPLQQLYPANFTAPITFQFSFICNEHTVFSQDSMTCSWEDEALPCEYAPDLYWMNNNFFREVPKEDGTGMRWAKVNEPYP